MGGKGEVEGSMAYFAKIEHRSAMPFANVSEAWMRDTVERRSSNISRPAGRQHVKVSTSTPA